MKRVLFVMNSLSTGGAERVLVNVLNNMDYSEFEPTLLTIFDNISDSNVLLGGIRRISYVRFRNRLIQGVLYKFFSKVLTAEILHRLFVHDTYDIEIAFLEGLPTKVVSGCQKESVRRIAWIHTDLSCFRDSDYPFKTNADQAESYKQFDRIVCVSSGVEESFRQRFGLEDKTVVIYNPVDEREIIRKASAPSEEPYNTKHFRFISVGRLHRQKGYDSLIVACSQLRAQGRYFELCIIGDGEERSNLEELLKRFHLETVVHLIGYRSNPYPMISNADAMVIASHVEGWSLASIEALILGIPIISTRVTGPREVLEDGKWGMLVEDNPYDLANGMARMMDVAVHAEYKELAKLRGAQFRLEDSMRQVELLMNEVSR